MKTNAIIRIIIWSLVIVLLVGLLSAGLLAGNFFRSERTSVAVIEEQPVPVTLSPRLDEATNMGEIPDMHDAVALDPDQVRQIEIEWVAGSITVQSADVDSIQIRETLAADPTDAMVWTLKNRKLVIRFSEESKNTINFGISLEELGHKDLTILVPADWECENLEVDAASASLLVKDLNVSEVDFNGASGTCDFQNCNIGELDLDTASGDIRFSGTLNSLDCDAASASVIAVFENVPNRIDMDSMSGDLDITLPSGADFTASLEALSSDFICDLDYTQRNGTYCRGDGKCRIDLDAMSGDLILREQKDTGLTAPVHHHTDSCTTNPESCPDNTGHHEESHHN